MKNQKQDPKATAELWQQIGDLREQLDTPDAEAIASEIEGEAYTAGLEASAGGYFYGIAEDIALTLAANPAAILYEHTLISTPTNIKIRNIARDAANHKPQELTDATTGEELNAEDVDIVVRVIKGTCKPDSNGETLTQVWADVTLAPKTYKSAGTYPITNTIQAIYNERGKVTRADILTTAWQTLLLASVNDKQAANAAAWYFTRDRITDIAKAIIKTKQAA